jgi:hypothetical protein
LPPIRSCAGRSSGSFRRLARRPEALPFQPDLCEAVVKIPIHGSASPRLTASQEREDDCDDKPESILACPGTSGRAKQSLPGLVELLLGLLLHDVQAGRGAQLTLGEAGRGWQVGDLEAGGHSVTASAPLSDGDLITLTVHADLADDAPTQAQLRRFIRPMVACVALEQRLKIVADQAQDAVAAIERMAVVDLATGIVMARRDCDAQTARDLLTDWSSREGFDLLSLTAADVLERLTKP